MLLKVIYRDGQERTVPSYALNFLIRKKDIIAFMRTGGWVELGEEPTRRKQQLFPGPGQRKNDVLLKELEAGPSQTA